MYFADVRMKAEDNCFVGFPAVWQMPLLVFLTFDPPPWVTLGSILLLGLGQFTWLKFIHPVRTARWRSVNLPICLIWVVLAGWSVAEHFDPPHLVKLRARRHQRLARRRRHRHAGLPGEAGGPVRAVPTGRTGRRRVAAAPVSAA